jgi:hypothetical protein
MAYHFRENGGTAGPGLNNFLLVFFIKLPDLFDQLLINIGAFL